MTSREFLDQADRRFEEHLERLATVTGGLTEDQLNQTTSAHPWSLFGLAWHMVKASWPYINEVIAAVPKASTGDETLVASTRFGRFLVKNAGPSGNVPAPRSMRPPAKTFPPRVASDLTDQITKFRSLAASATGRDLGSVNIRLPLLPIFQMTLYDCFCLILEHNERHIRQMEAVRRELDRG